MWVQKCCWAVLLLSATSVRSQTLTPCIRNVSGLTSDIPYLLTGPLADGFTATIRHTHDQKLTDGTTIHYSAVTTQAGDGTYMMTQRVTGCDPDENGQMKVRVSISVRNSAEQTFSNWDLGPSARSMVRIDHIRAMAPFPPPPPPRPRARPNPLHEDITREDLGTQSIAGTPAHGERITRSIPTGAEGNDAPIKVVGETWMSAQYNIVLKQITDDPRRGRDEEEFLTLRLGPPDPALFTPPANYTRWDPQVQAVSSK